MGRETLLSLIFIKVKHVYSLKVNNNKKANNTLQWFLALPLPTSLSSSPRRQEPTFTHTLRGAWPSPPKPVRVLWCKTRSFSAYPTALKLVSLHLLSFHLSVCLLGSNVSRLIYPVFVGLCFKEKTLFYCRLSGAFGRSKMTCNSSISNLLLSLLFALNFFETRRTLIWTLPLFFWVIPVMRYIHQSYTFIYLPTYLLIYRSINGGGGFHAQARFFLSPTFTSSCDSGHRPMSERIYIYI